MKTIWDFFISRHRFTLLVVIVATIAGLISVIQIPKESDPEVDIPFVVVNTAFPGASAQDVEELVTNILEDKLLGIEGVKSVKSNSAEGFSNITVEFNPGTEGQKEDVSDKVDEAQVDLPGEAEDPVVAKIKASEQPILIFSFSGPYDVSALSYFAQNLEDEIEKISGIAEVNVIGGLDREIQVVVDRAALDSYGLSISQVTQAISLANADIPIGSIQTAGAQYTVRLAGRLLESKQIENIPIATVGSSPILISDIASVFDSYKERKTISQLSLNGQEALPALTISVSKNKGGNIIQSVKKTMETIESSKGQIIPDNIQTEILLDMGDFVKKDLNNLANNGIQTIIIVTLLLCIFVGFKEAILAGLAIPLSFLITFIFMPAFGFSLNFLTLFSLILALGILIDTAVVVMERMNVYMGRENKTSKQAALLTVKEFQWPLITGTLTTIFAFLPLLLMSGIMGEYVRAVPITVTIVLLSSLFVGLGVIPSLAARRLKIKLEKLNGHLNGHLSEHLRCHGFFKKIKGFYNFITSRVSRRAFERLAQKYQNALNLLLQNKKTRRKLFIAVLVLFILSLSLPISGILKTNMFPPEDWEFFTIGIEKPLGTQLEETLKTTEKIGEVLLEDPQFKSFSLNVGYIMFAQSFTGGSSGDNVAEIIVNLVAEKDRDQTTREITTKYQKIFDQSISDAKISVTQLGSGPPSGAPIDIAVSGDSLNQLEKVISDLQNVLENVPGASNVQTTVKESQDEFVIDIDRSKAQLYGVSTVQLASILRNAISGTKATTIRNNGQEAEVIVKYALNTNDKLGQNTTAIGINTLESLMISTPVGDVPLSSFTKVRLAGGRTSVTHEDGQRTYRLQSQAEEGIAPATVLAGFKEEIKNYNLPEGVTLSYGGEQQDIEQSYNDMFRAMILAIFLIASILVLQFRSWRQPLFILTTVPLSFIGVFPGLMLVGKPISFPAIIGIVALAGIVVNNGIILIDRINKNRLNNMNKKEAIAEAAATRFRPIILTTITTIVGILPISLSSALWGGLGFTIIFGLLASSGLTLFVVPLIYNRFGEKELESD